MKRIKVPDYKDKNVFGVPLIVHVQRFGQPLPLGLQQALRYLRSQCLDQVCFFLLDFRLTCVQFDAQFNIMSISYNPIEQLMTTFKL